MWERYQRLSADNLKPHDWFRRLGHAANHMGREPSIRSRVDLLLAVLRGRVGCCNRGEGTGQHRQEQHARELARGRVHLQYGSKENRHKNDWAFFSTFSTEFRRLVTSWSR